MCQTESALDRYLGFVQIIHIKKVGTNTLDVGILDSIIYCNRTENGNCCCLRRFATNGKCEQLVNLNRVIWMFAKHVTKVAGILCSDFHSLEDRTSYQLSDKRRTLCNNLLMNEHESGIASLLSFEFYREFCRLIQNWSDLTCNCIILAVRSLAVASQPRQS